MGKNVFASRQEPVQNSSEETPSEADGVGCQAEGEWVMHEPKIPPSAYFLYVAGERERMRKTLGKPKALELQVFEIQSGWSKMDPERKAEFEARASQLQELYRVQKREHKQHGQFRSVPSSSSGDVNWKMPDAEPVQKSDEKMLASDCDTDHEDLGADLDENTPAFSWSQMPPIVDLTVDNFIETFAAKTDIALTQSDFAVVADAAKAAITLPAGTTENERLFTQAQVRKLLEAVTAGYSRARSMLGSR